jgi:hypothetical protein
MDRVVSRRKPSLAILIIVVALAGCAGEHENGPGASQQEPPMSEAELPIQNLDRVDVMRWRKDGGVDLAIVASGPLTAEPAIQKLLLDKVEAYLGCINSDEFRAEFENPPADKATIIISCYGSVDPIILELVERMKPWVEDNNARIRLEDSRK